MSGRFIVDLSLTLINRTGAYHICKDLTEHLPGHFYQKRYWRFHRIVEPRGVLRKLLGKAMLLELNHPSLTTHLSTWDWGCPARYRTLFLDPLYSLHSKLGRDDIVLCHDVGPVSAPELFDPRVTTLYKKAYDRIHHSRPGMVFVSEASRQAFTELFGTDFRFLEVIPLYVRSGSLSGASRAPLGIAQPFLLTVASQEIRKNYLRSIEAFGLSGLHDRGYSYVFCGPRANQSRQIEKLAQRTPGVHSLGYCDDEELRWLYRHASGFVLPSLLEGFGLPALEAAQHGLLSVISHDGALPEAVGGGAVLVDPKVPEAIATGMRRLIDMPPCERASRLSTAQRHVAGLTFDHFVSRWSHLLETA